MRIEGNDMKFQSYVKDNDLYVYDVTNKKTIRITTDGRKDTINGVPEWLYEGALLDSIFEKANKCRSTSFI